MISAPRNQEKSVIKPRRPCPDSVKLQVQSTHLMMDLAFTVLELRKIIHEKEHLIFMKKKRKDVGQLLENWKILHLRIDRTSKRVVLRDRRLRKRKMSLMMITELI